MSTREKQWLQIFERQQWIINQAKQQAFLFDQDLASKLIIAGISLPPWLLSSDPDVLNHHELISGVPLPRTRPVSTGSHFSVLDKPVDTAHYKQLTYGLCTEHCGVNKGFDVGGKVLDLPLCPISDCGCACNGVPQDHREEDPSVTSPEDERDAKVSEAYHDSALPPARGAGEGVSISPQCHISIAGCASNGVLQDQKEENPGGTSPQDQRDARILDIYHDPALSLARVQRSKSRQRALAIRNSTQKSCSQDKDNVNGYAGGTIKCVISTPQSEVEKPKIGEFHSKEKCTDIYSGRITRSRSSGHQENSLNVSGSPCIGRTSGGIAVDSIGTLTELSNHVIQPLELVSYCQITNDSCLERESKSGDYLSKEKRTVKKDSMCANLEREEYSPKALQEFQGRSISQEDAGKSIVSRSAVEETHLNEDHHMVERSESSHEAQRKEGGMGSEGVDSSPNAPFTFLHEEIKASVFSSLIKQAAGQPQDSLMEETGVTHPTSIKIDGGSQCIKDNPLSFHLQDNLRLENAKDLSCPRRTMQAKGFDFGGTSKFSELSCGAPHVKSSESENADVLNDNHSEVEKPKIGEFESKEKGTDIDSGRITRSRSSGHQENSLNASGFPCIGTTSGGVAVDFDNVGESCLEGLSTLAGKGIQGRSSVKMPLSFVHAEDEVEEGMAITTQENCNLFLKMNFLESREVLAKEMEVQSGLVEALAEELSKSRRVSNGTAVSSVKETFDAHKDTVVNTLLQSSETPKQKCSVIDGRTPLQVDWNGSVHSPVREVRGSKFSTANATKPTELVSEECAMDSHALCNPHISTDADFAMVSGPGSHRILDAETLEVENPYAVARNELRSNLSQSTINTHISPEYVQRSTSDHREVGCSESTERQIAENSKGRSFCYSMEGTLPKHKRRRIEDKRVHDLSASVALREEVFHTVKKDSMCANLEREEHSPKALEELQGHSISQEDAGKSIVSRSPVEETHLNEDHHMVERSASSPEAQKKEGGMGLEGVDSSPIAPFTFLHEDIEASVFSSLIKQAAGHPQDSLMEKIGVAHPTSINIDGGSQCIKENPLSPLLQDDLRLENVKDFSCAGRTEQAKRFDFGGTSKFSELSGCAPHVKSLDLIGADDAMPVLERFFIKTDDKPQSTAEEGISFDEWNLPNTAVERASILVQLCKSACMQTPVAYSSASYKLHEVPNLHRSVPTGLLEHVDLRSTLPINDSLKQLEDGFDCWSEKVGRAFCGRSYSDCLPNASEQSGWDIKKPYSSPVGKLWDRIASSSSSPGKRVSSIPELPCINEGNENTDDVTDTFQDGIVSEVLDCSSKRPPLADITEIPNPPASVSKAVPYTDRFSLDSVTTEFSLTGTQKSIKKKLGIQNSSKRRYNNKKNQSVSQGTKDIKRATGSLQNRSNKPKFPGKTSLRKGGPSLSEVEPKRNNIVSNITSFIPLVHQKQAAAALPGKRDIKVKALEAAEAAKRLAERKDNERKMKKEAMKVERARIEQENLRKLELQKNTKEEERKKNEADIAAKKRQREEDDRKEKQRKRMRVEEGRREQREHEDKLRAEKVKKEIKCLAIDGTRCESKESKGNTVHKKMDEEWEPDTLRSISETDPRSSCVSANNGRRGCAAHEEYYKSFCNFEHMEEVQCHLDKATENEKLVANTCREQSYDISPYKESDDENEEDDDSIPNNKFIPSWASKNCLALVASRQNRTDPEVFFPPESFCCISEVLLPRKCQQQ